MKSLAKALIVIALAGMGAVLTVLNCPTTAFFLLAASLATLIFYEAEWK